MRGRKKVWMTTMLLTLSVFRKFSDSICGGWNSRVCTGDVRVDIWSLVPPVVAIVLGAHHKGSAQFPVRRYFDRRCFLVRVPA